MAARFLQKKHLWPFGVLVIAAALIVPIVSFAASSPTINEWPTPVGFSGPDSIVAGPDGYLWFAEDESNQIGKVNPSTGAITEYNLPTGPPNTYSEMPDGITAGPDGNLWFGIISPVSGPPLLGKMTTSGGLTEYPLNSSMLLPSSLITGPDGNIWFAAYSGGYIGAMTTSGTLVHSYAVPNGPEGLSLGPDGNIWFVEQNADKVGKLNPSTGAVTTYSVPYLPLDTAAGSDGNIWFTGSYGNYVGKINPNTGAITTYTVPVPSITPYYGPIYITKGPDGNMWTSLRGYGLAKIVPSTGAVTEYETHNLGSGPTADGVTSGPDGNLWFTASDNNAGVGDLVLNTNSGMTAPAITSPNSTSVETGSPLNFTITASGLPTPTISESGSLPSGISFKSNSDGTATLSGTAAANAQGTYKLTLNASNSAGNASQSFTLTVAVGPNSNPGAGSNSSSGSGTSSSSGSSSHSASNATTAMTTVDVESYPTPVPPDQSKLVVQSLGSNQTEAVVTVGLDLSTTSYTVPSHQVLYDDGTLGQVTATAGATVKGSGHIDGTLTVDKGANLAPGHSPGCLGNGGLTLYGTYQTQIGGSAACTGYDQVNVAGKVTLAGTLSVASVDGYVPSPGQTFTILQLAGGAAAKLSGSFLGQPNGSSYSAQGVNYRVNYTNSAVALHVTSVDTDVASASAAAVSTKLVSNLVPRLVSKAILEFAALAVVAFLLLVVVVYLEARPQESQ